MEVVREKSKSVHLKQKVIRITNYMTKLEWEIHGKIRKKIKLEGGVSGLQGTANCN